MAESAPPALSVYHSGLGGLRVEGSKGSRKGRHATDGMRIGGVDRHNPDG